MAKQQQNQTFDIAEVTKTQDGLLPQNVKEQATDLLGLFANADESQLVGLTADYLELKENQTYNLIFTGFTTMKTDKGNEIKVAEFIDKDNKKYIHGSTVLVNSLSKVEKMPCLVRIVTKTKVKSSAGLYLDLDVLVIPATLGKVSQ
jgi:hypothetical protein